MSEHSEAKGQVLSRLRHGQHLDQITKATGFSPDFVKSTMVEDIALGSLLFGVTRHHVVIPMVVEKLRRFADCVEIETVMAIHCDRDDYINVQHRRDFKDIRWDFDHARFDGEVFKVEAKAKRRATQLIRKERRVLLREIAELDKQLEALNGR